MNTFMYMRMHPILSRLCTVSQATQARLPGRIRNCSRQCSYSDPSIHTRQPCAQVRM